VPWRPLPDAPGPEPAPLAAGLDRVRRALGAPPVDVLARVFASWPELVGEAVAAASRPVALDDGRLVVAVDDPVWASQLRWMGPDLVRRLDERLGEGHVAAVEVRVRPATGGA
jgi:predicted nucleic acid-binding Zn ribbon protein